MARSGSIALVVLGALFVAQVASATGITGLWSSADVTVRGRRGEYIGVNPAATFRFMANDQLQLTVAGTSCDTRVAGTLLTYTSNGVWTTTLSSGAVLKNILVVPSAGKFSLCFRRPTANQGAFVGAGDKAPQVEITGTTVTGVNINGGGVSVTGQPKATIVQNAATTIALTARSDFAVCDEVRFLPISSDGGAASSLSCSGNAAAILRWNGAAWVQGSGSSFTGTANKITLSSAGQFGMCYRAGSVSDTAVDTCKFTGVAASGFTGFFVRVNPPVAGAPTGLAVDTTVGVNGVTDSSVALTWSASVNVDLYRITVAGGGGRSVQFVVASLTKWVVLKLNAGTQYSFTIAARNAAGWSVESSAVVATTTASSPRLESVVASDPDNADSTFSAGDKLTVTFSSATNRGGAGAGATVDAATIRTYFTFGSSTYFSSSTNYNGQWTSATELVITITAGTISGTAPLIGQDKWAPTSVIKDASNQVSADTGAVLVTGSWGTKFFSHPGSISALEGQRVRLAGLAPASSGLSLTTIYKVEISVLTVSASGTAVGQIELLVDLQQIAGVAVNVTGTPAQLATRLPTARFFPVAGTTGTVTLGIRFIGGSDNVLYAGRLIIKIAQVNVAPVIIGLPKTISVVKTTARVDLPSIWVNDTNYVDGQTTLFRVSVGVFSGSLKLSSTVSGVQYSPNNVPSGSSPTYSLLGTLPAINAALQTLGYVPAARAEVPSKTQFFINVNDGGNGGGNGLSTGAQFVISITCGSSVAAPVLSTARFLEGSTIVVTFDRPVTVATGRTLTDLISTSCTEWFATSTVQLFGTSSKCVLQSSGILIRLGDDAVVNGSSTLTIVPNKLYACTSSSNSASGSVSVEQPTSLTTVVKVNLLGVTKVSACASLRLTWQIDGLAGRPPASMEWGQSSIDLSSIPFALTNKTFTIPPNLLPVGQEVQIVLTVTNWLGATGSGSLTVQRVSSNDVPLVRVLGPSLRRHSAVAPLVLGAFVDVVACQSRTDKGVSFSWSVSPQPSALVGVSLTGPRLVLRGGLLSPNTLYNITVTASYSAGAAGSSSFTAQVQTIPNEIVAVIRGGKSRAVGEEADLRLDASLSTDGGVVSSGIGFEWSCERVVASGESDTNCYNATSQEVITFSSSGVIVLSSGTLGFGLYRFTVVASVGSRSSTAEQEVEIVPGSPPLVRILGPVVIAPNQALRLRFDRSNIAALLLGRWTYSWSVVDKSLDLTASSVRGANRRDLVVNEKLTDTVFVPGRVYSFRLEVNDPISGTVSFAEQAVTVSLPPRGGELSVSPTTGQEATTSFTFTTGSWTYSGDIKYLFFYRDSSGRDRPLNQPQIEPVFKVDYLPKGNPLTVGVRAIDSIGATASFTTTVVVTARSTLAADVTSIINAAKTRFQEQGDASVVAQGTAAVATGLAASGGMSTANRRVLIQSVFDVRVNLDQSVALNLLSNVLNVPGTDNTRLTTEDTSRALSVLRRFVENREDDAGIDVSEEFFRSMRVLALNLRPVDVTKRLAAASGFQLANTAVPTSVLDAVEVLNLTRTELRRLTLEVVAAEGESYIFPANPVEREVYGSFISRSLANAITGANFGRANVTVGSGVLQGTVADPAVTPVDLHLVFMRDNLFTTKVINPLTGAAAGDGKLLSSLMYARIVATDGTPYISWNPNSTLSVHLTSDSSACSSPACVVRCALYDEVNHQWTTSGVSTFVSTDKQTTNCRMSKPGTVAAFSMAGPGDDGSEPSSIGDWRVWAAGAAVLILVLGCCMCCIIYHNPHLDPVLKKQMSQQQLEVGAVGRRRSFEEMDEEERKKHIVDHDPNDRTLNHAQSLQDLDHHEVTALARQWTQYFQSDHAHRSNEQLAQDAFIAEQLAARQQTATPGGPGQTPGRGEA